MPIISPHGLSQQNASTPMPFAEWDHQADTILIGNTQDSAALAPHFSKLKTIVVAFPSITDGRGFSTAKALRDAGYTGTLRVRGEITPDQYPFALLCGYNAVEISTERLARQPLEQWLVLDQAHLWRNRLGQNSQQISQQVA